MLHFLWAAFFCSNLDICVLSVYVFSAEFNIKKPLWNLTCKKCQLHVGLCHPCSCKNYQETSSLFNRIFSIGLDGDLSIPFLSAVIAVVLHWADMMPSHSMDLPVPRGTSMVMQAGKVRYVLKLVLLIVSTSLI